jgi:ADP-heptose:LPS heptosyltransferase
MGHHAAFLNALGFAAGDLQPRAWINPDDQAVADSLMASHGLLPERTVALFAAAQDDIRIYTGYGQALETFVRERGFRLVALGSAKEAALNQVQLDAAGSGHVNLCGQLTLRQSGALLKRCRLAVGSDTGLGHMACAVGTPHVIVLGGGHFGRFWGYSPLTTLAILPLDCYQCRWLCPFPASYCVKDLHPSVLATAIRETLEGGAIETRIFAQTSWDRPAGGPNLRRT